MVFNLRIIFSLLSNVILLLAFAESIPLLYSLITITKGSAEFLISTTSTLCLGILLNRLGKNGTSKKMTIKDMFLFTSIVWTILVLISAVPFTLILKVDLITSCYETASAISTTGSSVIGNINSIPKSILLWRSILQYMGGIGFIAMGIAILPNLNVGGMKLFQTENSEQSKESVTPKSKTLAKGILLLYLSATFIAYSVYYLLGMDTFDAFNHALTSLATGGMSTHNESMNYFSPSIHWAVSFFMFIGSLPFALMFISIKNRKTSLLINDQQVRGFIFIIFLLVSTITLSLIINDNYSFEHALRFSVFNVINILSSSGYTLEDYGQHGNFISLLFFLIIPLGACSGSTSGGLKIFRIQIAFTLFKRQIHQLMHPSAIFPQQYNNTNVNDTIIRSIIAFFFSYLMITIISSLLLCLSGLNILDSLSTTLSCLSNIGPAIGDLFGPNGDFSILTTFQKIILIIDMIMGRLEILTVLICFMPSFWKI